MQSNVTLNITPTTRAKLGVGGYLEERQYPNPDGGGVGGIFSQAMDASPVSYPVIYPGGLVPGRNPNGGERNPYRSEERRVGKEGRKRGEAEDVKKNKATGNDMWRGVWRK